MMTLAQFYAMHSDPNAIVIPGRVARLFARRRPGASIMLGPEPATPEEGVQAAQVLRRFKVGAPRGKKN